MPKPTNKKELLERSQYNFRRLQDLIDSYGTEILEKEFKAGSLNRNIRDVLTHLDAWHLMFLDWYKMGMSGDKPDMPAKGYTWQTLPDLNKKIWEECQGVGLEEARTALQKSYKKVYKIIETHSNTELFEKKKYGWTGSTSLGAYLISNASSHYDWAYKLIKKSLKG